jgi:hypothetical protein
MLSGPEHPGLKSETWATHSKSGGYGLIFDTPFRKGITLTAVFGPGQWRRPGAQAATFRQ